MISQRIVVTRPELNGKKLGSLRLRNHYGINISRVYRSGVQLLATPGLVLQLGDRLTVVGEADVETIELHGVPRIGPAISLQTRGCVMACRGRITGNGWSVSVNERARSARYR